MKKITALVVLITWCVYAQSQSSADAAVQLSVSLQSGPPQITLHWPAVPSTQYQVHRKLKTSGSWGPLLATLPGTATQYADTVTPGINYEYRVIRAGSGFTGYGYVNAGIEVPAIEFRGRVILIVDSTMATPLSSELARLSADLEGDGWEVARHDVDRNGTVTHIKSLVVAEYNADPLNTRAVFLFGHIPVPYSGFINPDGHTDHQGAWPADVFYGDVNGAWTDISGPGASTASPARTQNYPSDGKYDQSIVPGAVELQVGRVDLSSLPAFSAGEQQLLKNYLDKDHDYRKKIYVPNRRALVDDNFGYFSGEAFAASGYKNFGPLVGPSNVSAKDYISNLDTASYLWAYGCGGGSYTSAGGIGNTGNIAGADLKATFSMLFGSYFGDWDVPNSFLRAPLASGKVLTNAWSGRPHYQFHHMGLGENIGYSLLATQNNSGGLYWGSVYAITGKWIHNALMGDPTLRNDVMAPVSNVVAQKSGYNAHVSWTASPEPGVLGYNIYARNDSSPDFARLNTSLIAGTSFTDPCLLNKGTYEYMVRAVKLQQGFSGSYYNLSEGISDTAYNSVAPYIATNVSLTVIGNTVMIQNNTSLASNYIWDFGNGDSSAVISPTVIYANNGSYLITLLASNACVDSILLFTVNITGVGVVEHNALSFHIKPNPTDGKIMFEGIVPRSIYVTDLAGSTVEVIQLTENKKETDLSHLAPGIYFIRGDQSQSAAKLIISP